MRWSRHTARCRVGARAVVACDHGAVIYLLRVGWRLQLFAAAYQLGVELRTRLYDRLTLQGPPFSIAAHRRLDGARDERCRFDRDGGRRGILAGFDGTLTLILVIAMMALGIDWRLALIALLPFPLMAIALVHFAACAHALGATRLIGSRT